MHVGYLFNKGALMVSKINPLLCFALFLTNNIGFYVFSAGRQAVVPAEILDCFHSSAEQNASNMGFNCRSPNSGKITRERVLAL